MRSPTSKASSSQRASSREISAEPSSTCSTTRLSTMMSISPVISPTSISARTLGPWMRARPAMIPSWINSLSSSRDRFLVAAMSRNAAMICPEFAIIDSVRPAETRGSSAVPCYRDHVTGSPPSRCSPVCRVKKSGGHWLPTLKVVGRRPRPDAQTIKVCPAPFKASGPAARLQPGASPVMRPGLSAPGDQSSRQDAEAVLATPRIHDGSRSPGGRGRFQQPPAPATARS